MTLVRDGWIWSGRRRGAVWMNAYRHVEKVICGRCEAELADPDVFDRHDCENYRAGPELRVTEAARELADDEGVDLSDVDGSGAEGRITKADVETAVGDRE